MIAILGRDDLCQQPRRYVAAFEQYRRQRRDQRDAIEHSALHILGSHRAPAQEAGTACRSIRSGGGGGERRVDGGQTLPCALLTPKLSIVHTRLLGPLREIRCGKAGKKCHHHTCRVERRKFPRTVILLPIRGIGNPADHEPAARCARSARRLGLEGACEACSFHFDGAGILTHELQEDARLGVLIFDHGFSGANRSAEDLGSALSVGERWFLTMAELEGLEEPEDALRDFGDVVEGFTPITSFSV